MFMFSSAKKLPSAHKNVDVSKYGHEDYTHELHITEKKGNYSSTSTLRCIVVGETARGRLKVVIFGKANDPSAFHIKSVRYVTPSQVTTK